MLPARARSSFPARVAPSLVYTTTESFLVNGKPLPLLDRRVVLPDWHGPQLAEFDEVPTPQIEPGPALYSIIAGPYVYSAFGRSN